MLRTVTMYPSRGWLLQRPAGRRLGGGGGSCAGTYGGSMSRYSGGGEGRGGKGGGQRVDTLWAKAKTLREGVGA